MLLRLGPQESKSLGRAETPLTRQTGPRLWPHARGAAGRSLRKQPALGADPLPGARPAPAPRPGQPDGLASALGGGARAACSRAQARGGPRAASPVPGPQSPRLAQAAPPPPRPPNLRERRPAPGPGSRAPLPRTPGPCGPRRPGARLGVPDGAGFGPGARPPPSPGPHRDSDERYRLGSLFLLGACRAPPEAPARPAPPAAVAADWPLADARDGIAPRAIGEVRRPSPRPGRFRRKRGPAERGPERLLLLLCHRGAAAAPGGSARGWRVGRGPPGKAGAPVGRGAVSASVTVREGRQVPRCRGCGHGVRGGGILGCGVWLRVLRDRTEPPRGSARSPRRCLHTTRRQRWQAVSPRSRGQLESPAAGVGSGQTGGRCPPGRPAGQSQEWRARPAAARPPTPGTSAGAPRPALSAGRRRLRVPLAGVFITSRGAKSAAIPCCPDIAHSTSRRCHGV